MRLQASHFGAFDTKSQFFYIKDEKSWIGQMNVLIPRNTNSIGMRIHGFR